MAVFRYSRWRPSAILDFQKLELLTASGVERANVCVTVPNSVAIGNTVTEVSRFFDIQDGGSVISGLLSIDRIEISRDVYSAAS